MGDKLIPSLGKFSITLDIVAYLSQNFDTSIFIYKASYLKFQGKKSKFKGGNASVCETEVENFRKSKNCLFTKKVFYKSCRI